jgi:hypothetical protein
MFAEAASVGGLAIQLVYFRGFGEFSSSDWKTDAADLARDMTGVACRSGATQLVRVLSHALAETRREKIDAIVYVGDCFEEEPEEALLRAGELALHGTPAFVFHEGNDASAAKVFKDIARLTRGAYCAFNRFSAKQLAELLRAVAVYAAGGRKALDAHAARSGGAARLLTQQLSR